MRTVADYDIPAVDLVRQDGSTLNLREHLSSGGPVFVNFLFTSCAAVCPVSAMVFSELQRLLPVQGDGVQLLSISIDPLEDTPEKLAEYASKFEAGANWHFLTGTPQSCEAVQRAFDVYRGDKMNHPVVTFFRAHPTDRWVRMEGFAKPQELLSELQQSS